MRPSSCAVATAATRPVWPVKGSPIGVPVARSHTRTVSSPLPETTTGAPVELRGRHREHGAGVAGERVADRGRRWPGPTPAPSCRQLPEITTGRPSSCAVATADTGPVWPVKGDPTGVPVARSHTRIVSSALPEITTVRPSSCAVATPNTQLVWPVRACSMGIGAVGQGGSSCSGTVPVAGEVRPDQRRPDQGEREDQRPDAHADAPPSGSPRPGRFRRRCWGVLVGVRLDDLSVPMLWGRAVGPTRTRGAGVAEYVRAGRSVLSNPCGVRTVGELSESLPALVSKCPRVRPRPAHLRSRNAPSVAWPCPRATAGSRPGEIRSGAAEAWSRPGRWPVEVGVEVVEEVGLGVWGHHERRLPGHRVEQHPREGVDIAAAVTGAPSNRSAPCRSRCRPTRGRCGWRWCPRAGRSRNRSGARNPRGGGPAPSRSTA